MCFKAIAQSHFNEVFFFLTNVKYFVLSPISILLQFVFLDDLADLADDLDDLADDLDDGVDDLDDLADDLDDGVDDLDDLADDLNDGVDECFVVGVCEEVPLGLQDLFLQHTFKLTLHQENMSSINQSSPNIK